MIVILPVRDGRPFSDGDIIRDRIYERGFPAVIDGQPDEKRLRKEISIIRGSTSSSDKARFYDLEPVYRR